MEDYKLIDSSVWLAYLFNGQYSNIIDFNEIFLLSILSLFEIKKKLVKNNFDKIKIDKSIDFIKKRSLIIPINIEVAEKAVELSLKHDLPIIDSLIYATSQLHNSSLLTLDNDFRGLNGVIFLEP